MSETQPFKILVVDDEPDLTELLVEEIEFSGHSAVFAQSGNAAWKLCEQGSFDAVISDVRMPDGSGIDLLERLNSLKESPLVFLVSGYTDVTPEQAISLGAVEMISKPYNIIELCSYVVSKISEHKNSPLNKGS